jgi:hypothetical protein
MSDNNERAEVLSSFGFDEVDWTGGLDGTPLVTGETHIQSDGKPGIQPVGVKVSGEVWSEGDLFGPMRPAAPRLDELSAYQHKYYSVDFRPGQISEEPNQPVSRPQAELSRAQTWSSELVDAEGNRTGYHTVMIDIDHPVRVLPSSTAGHYHLYIDKPVGEIEYFRLLDALAEAGLVEQGYVAASKVRGSTHLRLPWVRKELGGGDDGVNLAVPGTAAHEATEAVDDVFELAPGTDPGPTVDRLEFVDEAEETARLSRLDHVRAKFAPNSEGEITFDPAEYSVVYVDGKGVLRRSRR